jgi:SAM-dependent methyltransferase
MSGFAAAWLAQRRPHDWRARSASLAQRFAQALGPAPDLLDLGCGAGSNLAYLAPLLPPAQRWRCIDHDPALLAAAEAARPAGIAARFEQRDLATGLEDLALGPGTALTASALLDLASAAWLDRLARLARGRAVLIALTFDGRLAFDPVDPQDAAVATAFLAHQRTDKGFGPALGPDAAPYLAERLRELGQEVELARSDWRLGPDDPALLRAMVSGIGEAAAAIGSVPDLAAWQDRRAAQSAAGRLQLAVGHLDLLALPPG